MRICLGSSCYRHGNQGIFVLVRDYIERNDLSSLIDFRGELCMGKCSHGPVIVIDDKIHLEINEVTVIPILEKAISDKAIK